MVMLQLPKYEYTSTVSNCFINNVYISHKNAYKCMILYALLLEEYKKQYLYYSINEVKFVS